MLFEMGAQRELKGIIEGLNRSQAVIHFDLDGNIQWANENFLKAMGYTLEEIQGKHHRLFVDAEYAASPEYAQFWSNLRKGQFQAAEYKRFAKGGREVWIQATYNPILDARGNPVRVVKFATDITSKKLESAEFQGQISAICKSQAVIHFDMEGHILWANENFLNAMGYALADIKGKHHRMFVTPEYKESAEYAAFWERLNRGEYQAAEYKRLGNGGREVWIQASYNPILDMNGKPFKVVKFATDMTEQVLQRIRKEEMQKKIDASLVAVDHAISEANKQSASAASASTQTSSNVQMVAAGAEELNASIGEISESMTKSCAVVENVASKAEVADAATQRLSQAAKAMGGIVETIENIASQINLLALNATIESARAGDAGKGFAVVANEVKNLAKQATDATKNISGEIENMQSISGEVVGALGQIKSSLGSVREYVTNTASAVEEQSAVAREMSSNMQMAAQAVITISGNLNQIATETHAAEESTKEVRQAVKVLVA